MEVVEAGIPDGGVVTQGVAPRQSSADVGEHQEAGAHVGVGVVALHQRIGGGHVETETAAVRPTAEVVVGEVVAEDDVRGVVGPDADRTFDGVGVTAVAGGL